MKRILFLTGLIITLALPCTLRAQTDIESLRREIQKAEEDIKRSTELLSKTRKDRDLSQKELKLVQSRIRSRKEMVANLEKQIQLLNSDIDGKRGLIEDLNKQLSELKEDYAHMVRAAYKNYKVNNFLAFLFASEDFRDAGRRVNLMRRYNQVREEKAREIMSLGDSITAEVQRLDEQMGELDQTRSVRTDELGKLSADESQYTKSVNTLRQQESKISQQIKEREKVIANAQKKIEQIIAEEARRNQKQVRTDEENRYIAELSGRFDQNAGKLPFPVRRGVITDRYGRHNHPTQKGLVVNNNGINISADPGSDVICVFEGTVGTIIAINGYNNTVIIRHGNYLTVYANLATVTVRTGQQVTLNQKIGTLSTNPEYSFLHFEIAKDLGNGKADNLNPETWLNR